MANPAAPVAAALPAVPDLTWQLVGAADFDGDQYPDLLWRNTTWAALNFSVDDPFYYQYQYK